MKKLISILILVMTMTVSVNAMSYEQARQQALFLTDKMAYELNLNEAQYEAAYEVNLDYLMSINHQDDLYGIYWRQRNLDLSYILLDWQYSAFCAASYFYRPLYWRAGFWHFGIYARYPRRDYYYFGHPHFITVYVGGHSWHRNGGRSWYHGRTFVTNYNKNRYFGMRDSFKRGDYGNGHNGHFGNGQHKQLSDNRNKHTANSGSFGNRVSNSSSSGITSIPASRFGGVRSGNALLSQKETSIKIDTKKNSSTGTFGGGRTGNRTGDIGNSRGMLSNPSSGNRISGSFESNRNSSPINSKSSSFGSSRNSSPINSKSSSFGSNRQSSGSSKSTGANRSSSSSSNSRFGGRR